MKYNRFHDIGKLEERTFCPNCLSDKHIFEDPQKGTFDQSKVVCRNCGFSGTWFRIQFISEYHAKRLIAENKFISSVKKMIKRDLNKFELRYCKDLFYNGMAFEDAANDIKDTYKEIGNEYIVTVKISKGWPGLYRYEDFTVIAKNEHYAKNRIFFLYGFFGLGPMDITYYCERIESI